MGSLPTGWANIFYSYYNEDANTTRLILEAGGGKTYYNINSKAGGSNYVTIAKTVNTIYTESIKAVSNTSFKFTSNGVADPNPVNRINGNEYSGNILLSGAAMNLRIYYFKIYDGENLIRDFIPCITLENDTFIAGMYDKVEGKFYKSASYTGYLYSGTQGGQAEASQEYSYGETKKLKKNEFERLGYTFTGWNTKADGTGTAYADEQIITNSTLDEITIDLYAQWEDTTNPNLELSKETYQEGFDDWELTGGAYVDEEGILNLPNESSVAQSIYYPTGNEFWYPTYEAYTTEACSSGFSGGDMFISSYYNQEYEPTTNLEERTSNACASLLNLNTWNNLNFFNRFKKLTLYGNDIEYIRLRFGQDGNKYYNAYPERIRNFKLHGQLWAGFYDIIITTSDYGTGVKLIKYADGERDTEYFKTNGTVIAEDTIRVTENGKYTVYVEDNAGNSTVETIEITKIDTTEPTTTKPEYTQLANGIQVINKQEENESRINKVQYAIKKAGEEYGEWQDSDTFTGLKHETTYFIKTRTTNIVNLSSESEEEQIYTDWMEPSSTFLPGETVNAKMKQLAGNSETTYDDIDTNITSVKRSSTIEDQYKTSDNIVSTSDSESPIYMWYDNGTIYWYTEDEKPSLNANSIRLFENLVEVTSIDAEDFDTSNVTNTYRMFAYCRKLTNLNVSNFDTANVTYMMSMFSECNSLTTIDVSNFDTSKVTAMGFMFNRCNSLTALDVSNFDTAKVVTMYSMFNECNSLTALDVSHFDTSNVSTMHTMFLGCSALTDLDVSNFDTRNVMDMYQMFCYCSNLTTIYASDKFVVDKFEKAIAENGDEIDSRDMFYGCTKLVGGAGTIYNRANIDKTYAHIDGGPSNPGYFTPDTSIKITPSTLEITGGPITATVEYGEGIVSGKKAGYGSTLEAAQSNASTSTATSVQVTGNGYIYAEGIDMYGNPVTATLEITNIH